jgi:membrane-associated phospholipid phosphatase
MTEQRKTTIRFYGTQAILYVIAFSFLTFAVFTDRFNLPLLDNAVSRAVHDEATPQAVTFFLNFTHFGLEWLWGVIVIGGLFFLLRRDWSYLAMWLFGWVGGQLANEAIKALFNRARPVFDPPFLVASRASFPSGHAMMSAILYGLLTYLVLKRLYSTPIRALVITLTMIWVGLIGFSRVLLGVHYPTDVIGGWLAGLAWLSLCVVVLETLEARRVARLNRATATNSVPAASA